MRITIDIRYGDGTVDSRSFEGRSEIVIGRDPLCTLPLSSSAGTVSARHVTLRVTDDRVFLVDAGSRNGTFVDGVRVTSTTLGPDQEVRLGLKGPTFRVFAVTPTVLESPIQSGDKTTAWEPDPKDSGEAPTAIWPGGKVAEPKTETKAIPGISLAIKEAVKEAAVQEAMAGSGPKARPSPPPPPRPRPETEVARGEIKPVKALVAPAPTPRSKSTEIVVLAVILALVAMFSLLIFLAKRG